MNSSRILLNESSANFAEGPPNAKKRKMSTISGGNEESILKAENERLKSELSNLEEIVKKKDQIIVKQVMDIHKFQNENAAKEMEVSTLKKTEAELRSTNEDLEETIRMHGENTNDEMENDKIAEMEEHLQKKNDELKALEEKNATMEVTINNLLAKNSGLNQKEEDAQGKVQELEDQLLIAKNNENQLRSRISELENVENKLAEVTINLNDLAKKNSEMKQQEENMKKLISDKDKQIKDLKEQIPNSSEDLSVKHVSLNDIFDGKEITWDADASLTVVNVKKIYYDIYGWWLYSDDGTVLSLNSLKKCDANFKLNLSKDFICYESQRKSMKILLDLVYSLYLKSLRLCDSQIRHQDFFQLLSSHTIADFCFARSSIEREDKPVNIDEMLKELPNIKTFKCFIADYKTALDKETLINIAKLPPFSKLQIFELEIHVVGFDIEAFCTFIKNCRHQDVNFVFRFYNNDFSFIDELKKETKKAIAELQKNYQLSVKFMRSPTRNI